MIKIGLKIISILSLAYLAYITFSMGIFSLSEGKHLFNPYIDTVFEKKYSPDKFNKIKVGTNISEAIAILGEPLYKVKCYEETQNTCYHFTGDGKLFNEDREDWKEIFCDFAWYCSILKVNKKGKVTSIEKGWRYD